MMDRRNIANLYPLSPLQEGMLFHALREPRSRAYFEQLDFELPGALDAEAYLAAWQDLVQRHDILRTVFLVRGQQQPLQVVLREQPLQLQRQDLRQLDATQAEQRIAAWRAQDLARGFDLAQPEVPMRLALFTLPAGVHRVVWSFHHILLDGWSLAVLQADLDALYEARLQGRRAALPPPVPYVTAIRWWGSRERGAGLAFWQQQLQGLQRPTPVPRRLQARFAASAADGARGEHRHVLAEGSATALAQLAASQGVTPSVVVQSLWGLWLARQHGQRDAAFAATVSGRPAELEGAERCVGLFINAVPVRVRWQAGESYAALLARLHAEGLAARAHHDCPLPDVQAAHPLGGALFDHILVFENYPQLPAGSTHGQARTRHLYEHTHYPFEFQFLPGARPVLRLRFDRQLFDAASMAVLGEALEAMLLAAAADPLQPVDRLAWPQPAFPAPRQVVLAASFTAEPIAQSVDWWLGQLACPWQVQLAPYNQCATQLAQADSLLRGAGLGVLLLRFADAARDLQALPPEQAASKLEAQCELLLALLRQHAGPALLVVLLPSAPAGGPLDATVCALEARWQKELSALPAVTLVDLRALGERHGLAEVFDPAADRLGHIPFTEPACEAIAGEIARALHARARPPFKVAVLDCDQTLWAGVVGEVGPRGVQVQPGHRALQQFMLALHERGWLLALASKNHPDDVWAVFDQHPDMLLRREHIAAAEIGWDAKSQGLRRIAARLNLGVDSLVLVDDNPLECAEVMRNCPEALALVLPPEPQAYAPWLARAWAFDQAQLTAEDRERGAMMQAEARRQAALAEQAGQTEQSPEALLAQLRLQVRVGPAQPHQWARVAQLTQRTNQFNLSGKRRDEAQLLQLAAEPGVEVLAVEVEDRFGAYGLTGVAITRAQAPLLQLDTLLLSCRVLGRQVEFALLQALARRAQTRGCRALQAQLVPTTRNEPVQRFLASRPWRAAGDHQYICALEEALALPLELQLDHQAVFAPPAAPWTLAPATTVTAAPAAQGSAAPELPDRFPMEILNEAALRHGNQYLPLLAACAGWPRKPLRPQRQLPRTAGRAPASATEQAIAAVWSEVLGQEVNDAEAGFARLGGHSLHAVRIVARLERQLQRAMPLQLFLEQDTIAAQAAWFDATDTAPPPAAQPLAEAPPAEDYPLAPNQQRLWLLTQLEGGANLHNLCAAWRLQGPLDRSALQQALQQLVARHAALRTVIRLRDGQPRQQLLAPAPLALPLEDAPAGGEPALRERIAQRARQPFALADAPLFRAELHKLADQDHVLVLYLHHLVSDGWSFGLLLRELAALYARARGLPAELPPAPALRYVDYACWSRARAEAGQAIDARFWEQLLQPLPEIARVMPDAVSGAEESDHRPGAHPDLRGAVELRRLPVSLQQLQAWCARHGATPFGLLAALVAVLLWRCGGASDVRLGLPAAGRARPELEGIIGFFANTLVLPLKAQPEQPFSAWLGEAQRRLAQVLAHQEDPFDRVVAQLQPARETDRHPLFDVLVVLQDQREGAPALAELSASDFPVEPGLAEFDLVFEFGPTGDGGLACALRYRSALYRADTAAWLQERLASLLQAALAQPATPLQALSPLSAREQERLQACMDGGQLSRPQATIAQLFADQAARTPGSIAVADRQGRLDYRGLDARANAFARQLVERHGITPGTVVALRLERGIAWAVALLGVLKAGAVYLPLEPQHPPARHAWLLQRAGARVLVAEADGAALLAGLDCVLVAPPEDREAATPPVLPQDPGACAYLIFTSGSTGEPKGVRVPHRAFVNMILGQIEGFAVQPQDCVLQLASCAFDASLSECFMAWLAGARLAIASPAASRDGHQLARELRQHEATLATFTPSHLRQLEDAQLAGLRKIILAGEAVRGQDVQRLLALGLTVFNAYGPTETAVCATLGRVEQAPPPAAPVAIGRPLPNLQLHVVDAQGRDQPLGVPGELVVQGVGVALGYLHGDGGVFFRTDAGQPAYRTGDIARWLPDGQLEYLGRRDAQVKIRGHRVEPAEVAAALATLPGVRQAEVLVLQGPLGPYLAAALAGEPRSDAWLREQLSGRLPGHMMPARWHWWPALPLTSSGKLDRAALEAALRAPMGTAAEAQPADPEPGTLAARLLAIWRELLPGALDQDSNFFEAGGDSLAAMQAARRIGAALGRPLSALQLFRTPTVRGLAAALQAGAPGLQVTTLGQGPQQVLALPPWPGLEAGYGALARALPQARLHMLPFRPLPVPQLLAQYAQLAAGLTGDAGVALLGYSGGGAFALALAQSLVAAGRPPRAVVLVDSWQWSGATPEVREQLQAELAALAPAADPALARAYLEALGQLSPRAPLPVPVHHLLATDVPASLPAGASRDWRALAGAGYHEHPVAGSHHQLLAASHVEQTAARVREVLALQAGGISFSCQGLVGPAA